MFKDSKTFSSFSVDDLEVAKKFYGETLGLDIKDDPMGILEVTLYGGSKLMIYPKPDHKPASFTVLNFVVENIDKAVDDLTSKGVKFEQYTNEYTKTDKKGISRMPDGPSMAWFADPAGNILGVLQEH